jgi:hypothetical protein
MLLCLARQPGLALPDMNNSPPAGVMTPARQCTDFETLVLNLVQEEWQREPCQNRSEMVQGHLHNKLIVEATNKINDNLPMEKAEKRQHDDRLISK